MSCESETLQKSEIEQEEARPSNEGFDYYRERMLAEQERIDKAWEALSKSDLYNNSDGWNCPPAQIPRPGELAMGIYFDRDRNTRRARGK